MTTQSNDIGALRDILFDTLRKVKAGEMAPDQAKGVNDLAQTLINTAKVEVDFIRATGGSGTGFVPLAPNDTAGASQTPTGLKAWNGGVTVHKLRG
ncbi:MAG: hypothetical protein Q8O33_12920 [Pseudomonadota bacterium]|nr:hypothetical protein [Pseudomonadota bacterium]